MPDKVRPIKPQDVTKEKKRAFPDAVLSAFNELIAQKYSGNSATIKQSDVVALMIEKGLDRGEIYDKGWLDVEEIYGSVGWSVVYDKPGYNESYPATFTFKPKPKQIS
jgi:hypothetical protein